MVEYELLQREVVRTLPEAIVASLRLDNANIRIRY